MKKANEIYKSDIGKSREKEYQSAYTESLNNAFNTVYALNYAYNGNTNFAAKTGITAQSLPVVAAPTAVAATGGRIAVKEGGPHR